MNAETERNLKRYRRWLHEKAISRVVQGFLPTFVEGDVKRLTVIVDEGGRSYTDGKTICVSLPEFVLQDSYSEEDWMIVLRASAAHEAQHVNSSNFKDIEEIRTWYSEHLATNYALDPAIGLTIAKNANNIVEDGRIEGIAIKRRPGMLVPFRFLNDKIRAEQTIEGKAGEPKDEYVDFWKNVLSYAKTGLYAPGIKVYAKTPLEFNFLGIRGLIDEGVAAKTSADCKEAVKALLEDISPYLAKLIQDSPDLQEALKEPTPDEYTSNNERQFGDGNTNPNGNPLRVPCPVPAPLGQPAAGAQNDGGEEGESAKEKSEQEGHAGKDEKGEPVSSKNNEAKDDGASKDSGDSEFHSAEDIPMSFSNAEDSAPPLTDEQMEEARKLVSDSMVAAQKEERAKKQPTSDTGLNKRDVENIVASYVNTHYPFNQETLNVTGTEDIPAELKLQAQALRRDIIKIQDARNRPQKNLRRGALDTGALWKSGAGDDRLFTRKGCPDTGSVVFYILIDNSGSMASSSGNGMQKYVAARIAASVIEEATKSLVPCKIALFNQSGRAVNHVTIRSFDESGKVNRSWNSLSTIGPGGCNADSVNIRVASAELTRRPERKKVLLILSDGAPSAYGSRGSATVEVKTAVSEGRRKGNIIIPIMFGDQGFLQESLSLYKSMYEKDIIACEPQVITERLAQLFRLLLSR